MLYWTCATGKNRTLLGLLKNWNVWLFIFHSKTPKKYEDCRLGTFIFQLWLLSTREFCFKAIFNYILWKVPSTSDVRWGAPFARGCLVQCLFNEWGFICSWISHGTCLNTWQHLNWRTEKHIGSVEAQSVPRQERSLCQGKFTKIKNTNIKCVHNPGNTEFGVRNKIINSSDI